MVNPIIEAKDLRFFYEEAKEVSLYLDQFRVLPGECLVLCGPSGSGKSTLLKLLNGLIPEYRPGQVEGFLSIAGFRAGEASTETLSHQVASVFQNPSSQFFHQLVKEELVFAAENQGRSPQLIRQQLEELVETFGMADYLERSMLELSGGEKQRVAILSAMMQDTPILLLDEPTANLDHQGIEQVAAMIQQLKAQGKTIVIAEHRLHYLMEVADRFCYLEQGQLTQEWTTKDFQELADSKRQGLGLRSWRHPEWGASSPRETVIDGLRLEKVQVRAGGQVLQDLDGIVFERGAVTAILGPNGVGKSTLAQYLVGLKDDPKGDFRLDGCSLKAKERLRNTALVLQEVRLQLFSHEVDQELTLGLGKGTAVEEIKARLGLTGLGHRHPMTLSGGEQQRLLIASQILSDKEIFVFDEPTSGLDYLQMEAVASLLRELADQGKVLVLISHDEELVSRVADQKFFLSKASN